jgi:predicted CXXCH cytochrome family protein
MNGYWDLSKGPRERHSCLNCHDPHKPAYPKVMPAPGPKDRFLGTPAH